MSFQAMAWAVDQPAKGLGKLVLLLLANYADEDGTCFPKQDMLARQAGCSLRSVKYALQALRDGGYLKDEKRWRTDGTQGANRYRLPIKRRKQSANGALYGGARVQNTTGQSANGALYSKEEDTITYPITKNGSEKKNDALHPQREDRHRRGFETLSASLANVLPAETKRAARMTHHLKAEKQA